jgi:chromosome segregation ATPase
MKNFHQNLLMVLAMGLCGLCAYQWYGQTLQRNRIVALNQLVFEQSTAIQGYTNSIKTMDRQLEQLDGRVAELRETVKTNEQWNIAQKLAIHKLEVSGEGLTNQIAEYRRAVEDLEGKLKAAYEGVKKQNEAIKELVVQRDDFLQKLNDSLKERNEIVAKYNDLVARVEKLQAGGGKATDK